MIAEPQSAPTELLTYEEYMAEEATCQRYDILDGVRVYMSPTRSHQAIVLNLLEAFRRYERKARNGRTILSPCDILITRVPLRTRQPDILSMSKARLAQNPPMDDPTPLQPAPELVVEILSPNETRRMRADKLADYQKVGVLECWVIHQDTQSVEVLTLTPQTLNSIETYGPADTVQSVVFPGLKAPVARLFEGTV